MPGSQDPSWTDVINELIKAGTASMHTSMPAIVVTYNPALQTVTVQPVIRQRVDDVTLDREVPDLFAIPPISNVPVVWPSGLTWAITGPLVPGDPVTLIFSERSTDEWRALGLTDNVTQDARRFDLADAVAIPGGRSVTGTLTPTAPKGPTTVDPVAVVMSTSVPGGIKLGSNIAVDAALKGTIFEVDLLAFMTAMDVYILGVSTATTAPQIAALAVTFSPFVTAFEATVSSGVHRSLKVLIE